MTPILIYIKTKNLKILFAEIVIGHFFYLFLLGILFIHKKKEKRIDIEIATGIALLDWITRFYLHPAVSLLNNSLIFSFLLLFLIRQLKLPIKKNMFFLMGYGSFYFILSFKYLNHNLNGIFYIEQIILTIALSLTFAYSLLATAIVKNFYRCSYCGALAILCLIVLGQRMLVKYGDHQFLIAHISCLILMAFLGLYWYEGKEYYIEAIGKGKKYFNIEILPNLMCIITFFLYIFQIHSNDILVVWSLITIASIWYFMSIIAGLRKTAVYADDAILYEELNSRQLDRIGRYAKHLRNASYLKKKH